MTRVIDLAGVRSRHQQRPNADPCAGSVLTEPLPNKIQALYRQLARGTADSMPEQLREWLRCWARRRGIGARSVECFVGSHRRGLSITIDAAQHDAATARLLAPELLVALLGLHHDADALRADWPTDRRELDALADAFGRPFAG